MVKEQSKLIQIEEIGTAGALERVAGERHGRLAGAEAAKPVRVTPDDYVGNSADRTGFGGLEAIDPVTMLAVPDLMAVYQQGMIDLEGVQAVQLAMIAHCELMGDRVAILDAPPGLNAQQIREWRVDKVGYDSKYATLYWPWIKVFDPLAGQGMFVPAVRPHGRHLGAQRRHARRPQGAGQRGRPRRARPRAAASPRASTTSSTRTGINCIRSFPGRGIRVWGARTLSSDPAWRYLNVRRLFNYVEESILEGTQWVVFEPNDLNLWAARQAHDQRVPARRLARRRAVRRDAGGGVLRQVRRRDQPARVDRRAASSIVEIGIAPVKPAEFVDLPHRPVLGRRRH